MKLKIVTPDRVVLEADVDEVTARSVDGEFGVLPHHIPMVTPLDIGLLTYVQKGKRFPAAVMGGLFQTDGDTVAVLSDSAELATEIDVLRAQHAKERAESRLKVRDAHLSLDRAQLALNRALIRLRAAGRS